MRPLTLQEVVVAIGGRVYGELSVPTISRVSTDSRTVEPGSLFFAIAGEHYDGHDFAGAALDRGASAVVVSDLDKIDAKYRTHGRVIQVPDTVASLGRLAGWYRKQVAATVIAVAGSNGKTTTKDMLAEVLGVAKCGRAAPRSFNNAIGVPLTLLAVEPADEFVVVEIGTNHPGEVVALGRIAQPDVAVITSIGEEHLEFFGDVQGAAREEFSLLTCLRGRAFAAIGAQAAEYAPAVPPTCTRLIYGLTERADVRATDLVAEPDGYRFKVNARAEYFLPVLGRHNVENALAAVAVAMRFRMSEQEIARGLAAVRLPPMRMQRVGLGDLTIINDAYNANPSSMRAALDVLDRFEGPGRKVLLLGDMKELGDASSRCHQQLGRDAGRSTAQVIIAAGAFARIVADGAVVTAGSTKRIYHFPTVEAVCEKLSNIVQPGDVVLLKASRSVGLERVLEALKDAPQPIGR